MINIKITCDTEIQCEATPPSPVFSFLNSDMNVTGGAHNSINTELLNLVKEIYKTIEKKMIYAFTIRDFIALNQSLIFHP